MNKIIFKIQDQDNTQPFVEMHYYKWLLKKGKQDIHGIKTKHEYLKEQGFTLANHKLTEEDYTRLKYCEQAYFTKEIKPNLIKNNY